jgi:hypothetical protein
VGTSVCEGNTVKTCVESHDEIFANPPYWETSKCDVACATIAGSGTCVATASPVAACAHDGNNCRDGGIIDCLGGYVLSSTSCELGLRCADTMCGPMCVRETVPEPRCNPNAASPPPDSSSFCDGNEEVTCQCGFVLARDSCGAGQCKSIGSETQCLSSSTTDPRCGDPAAESSGFCDGNVARSCWYGFVVGSADCGTGQCIVDAQLGAGCQYPVSS